jgi:hypothetical protein
MKDTEILWLRIDEYIEVGIYTTEPCRRCHAFAARIDTGMCEWCTAEPTLCQCLVCVKRRAAGFAELLTRPSWRPAPPPTLMKAEPTSAAGCLAYLNGLCKTCCSEPRRAGHTECDGCWSARTGHNPNPNPRVYDPNTSAWRRIRPMSNFDESESDDSDEVITDESESDDSDEVITDETRSGDRKYSACACGQPLLASVSINRGQCEVCHHQVSGAYTTIADLVAASERAADRKRAS